MGATSWRYYTPYHPDPGAALFALQADVFDRGDYLDPVGSMADSLRRTARRFGQNPDEPEVRRQIEHDLRVHQAVETGDTRGLPPGDRALVRRLREFRRLAGLLGAPPPPRVRRSAAVGRRAPGAGGRVWNPFGAGHRAGGPADRVRGRDPTCRDGHSASVRDA